MLQGLQFVKFDYPRLTTQETSGGSKTTMRVQTALLSGLRMRTRTYIVGSSSAYIVPHLFDAEKWKDLEKTVIRFEFSNQTLRIENEHLKEELNSMIGIPDRDTESDTEVRGKKRSRSEITVGPTRRDATDSDTESQSEKRARR